MYTFLTNTKLPSDIFFLRRLERGVRVDSLGQVSGNLRDKKCHPSKVYIPTSYKLSAILEF